VKPIKEEKTPVMSDWDIYRRFLATYLRPMAGKVALLMLAFLVVLGLDLWLPRILADFIDRVVDQEGLTALLRTAGLFLGVGFLSQLMIVAETYIATDIGLEATNQLRSHLALKCLNLDLSFHNARTPGELIERVDGDAGVLNRFFSRFIIHIVGNILLLIGILALLFIIDIRVGAALTAFTVTTMFFLSRLSAVAIPHWNRAREARAKYYGFIEEHLSGTEDLRANGAVGYAMRGLTHIRRSYFRKDLLADSISTVSFASIIILFSIGGAIALGLAAWIYLEGTITLGTAYLIVGYTQLITQPIERIIRELDDLQEAGASLRRVNELMGEDVALLDGQNSLPGGPLHIAVENLSFTYPDAVVSEDAASTLPVLQDITFDLNTGTILGLLGRTGSGKTTLTRLLFRLYDPQKGQISFNGQPLSQLSFASIRHSVGVVTQEVQLFNATIRENLTFFDHNISDTQIRDALRQLDLLEWVESFPKGLDTQLKSAGEGLSAGEAQLLAFTRVFLKDPCLVILDEASSRLDPATEALLEKAIQRLMKGRTGVIIAHRLATVQHTDEVMILEAGHILEHGRRIDLIANPESHFARLLEMGLQQEMA
jgi:ABC-type multidrug transport system fused ATPase/permease subunit